ncbi:MAG: GntR family transcriptional regulator [Gemmatimonadota bacterium]
MFDQLDPRSPTPLYAQIAERIRAAVAAGDLQPGDALPSVRGLAAELRVNPATVVQAYRDLENDGFVVTRRGAGSFVRAMTRTKRGEERARQARTLVRDMMAEAARLGIDVAELAEAFAEESGVPAAKQRRSRATG